MKNNNKKGFTLVEILVVIAIIGLLATIVMISLSGVGERGNNARRIEDLRSLHTALISYYYHETTYHFPNATGAMLVTAELPSSYITEIPEDPDPLDSGYFYEAFQRDETSACTTLGKDCKQFILCADLEPYLSDKVFCCDKEGCVESVATGYCNTLSSCP
ncbi:type II secretion system protein [bacterium]|nr:MAG: type II secretion system protein [bacterium]